MNKALILLLRNAEWQVSEVAFAEMRGHGSARRRAELADTLVRLLPLLGRDVPLIIDAPGDRPDRP